jgi:aspartyl-tRNA(Asn)/glutamyl-tRNA(Gln) amidotransferase subunit C
MATSDFDVKYVAQLARLSLTPAEEEKIGGQLMSILQYIEKLKELNVDGVEPTAHAVPLINVARPDEAKESMPHEEALRNAPATANGLFLVPKIVE